MTVRDTPTSEGQAPENKPELKTKSSAQEETEGHITHKQRMIIAIAGGTVALTAALGVGMNYINSNGEKAPEVIPTSEPAVTNEAPAVPEQAPTTSPEVAEELPENLKPYQEMSTEAFSELPKSEQAIYYSWLVKDLDTFVADWKDQRSDTVNTYVENPSLNDSPQEIVDMSIWMQRISFSQNDPIDVEKATIASLWDGVDSPQYPDLEELVFMIGGSSARAQSEASVRETPIVDSASPIQQDTMGNNLIVIHGSLSDGRKVAGTSYYMNFTGYDGQPFATWVEK